MTRLLKGKPTQGHKLTLVLYVTTILLIICTLGAPAFSQSGSAGGSIGKQGKSASGGDNASPARRAAPRRPAEGETAVTRGGLSAANLEGSWAVSAKCSGGNFEWRFAIRATSDTEFVGDYNPGSITDGTISGNQISFVGSHNATRNWKGTISRAGSGMNMRGSFTGATPGDVMGHYAGISGNCTFTAAKQ
jgi:hypothetical protein